MKADDFLNVDYKFMAKRLETKSFWLSSFLRWKGAIQA